MPTFRWDGPSGSGPLVVNPTIDGVPMSTRFKTNSLHQNAKKKVLGELHSLDMQLDGVDRQFQWRVETYGEDAYLDDLVDQRSDLLDKYDVLLYTLQSLALRVRLVENEE